MAKLVTTPKLILILYWIVVVSMVVNLYQHDRDGVRRTLSNLHREEDMILATARSPDPISSSSSSSSSSNSNGRSSSVLKEDDIPIPLPPYEEQVPKFIIAGVQKGGTTALYDILKADKPQFLKHAPLRCRASPELHFFDRHIREKGENWTLPGLTHEEWQKFLQDEQKGLTPRVIQALRKEYAYCWNFDFMKTKGYDPKHSIAFEKTPIYMIYPGLPALLKTVTPWVKILFMIRDPVSRAYSSWKMHHHRLELNETFELYLNSEIQAMQQQGVSNAPTLDEYILASSNREESAFQPAGGIPERRLKREKYVHDTSQVPFLYRGMYAELLTSWMEHFTLGENLMVVSYERFLQNRLEVVQQVQQFVGANVTSNFDSKILQKDSHHGGYTATPLNDTTRQYLQHFFQPYNDELRDLLGQEWYEYHVGDMWSTAATTTTTTTTTTTIKDTNTATTRVLST